jgi:STE24 endopeptidase
VNESKATRYQRLRRRAQGASVGAGAALLILLTVTSGSRWLEVWARTHSAGLPAWFRPIAALALYVACVSCLWELLALPAVLYLGLHVERRFRQAERTVAHLLAAHLQSAVIGGAVVLGGSIVVRTAMAFAGAWWWTAAGVLMAAGLVAAFQTAPLLLPLAGQVRPLARPVLAARVAALASRARVPIVGLYEWRVDEAERATALIAGLGRTRRAVISEAITREWSDDEIEVVLAHELAHHAHHDLWRTLALDALVLSVALGLADRAVVFAGPVLGFRGPRDLAALPLLALTVGAAWLLATPMRHAQSRWHERRADRFALATTGRVEAFSSAVRRLGAQHLAEERPSRLTRWLYHRHPTVEARLAMASRYRRTVRRS